jgi:O-antigen/teichoic acid export membrane protein
MWILVAFALGFTLAGIACFMRSVSRGDPALSHTSDGLLVVGYTLSAIWSAASGDVAGAVFGSFLAALFAWLWWRNRRRRDRAPRSIGDKTRRIIAALVAKVREAAKPRPALRPAPGGTR